MIPISHTHTQYPNITAKYQVFFIVLFSLLAYTGLIFCEKYVDRGFLWFLHIFFLYHQWFQDSVRIPGLRAGWPQTLRPYSPIHLWWLILVASRKKQSEIRKQASEDGYIIYINLGANKVKSKCELKNNISTPKVPKHIYIYNVYVYYISIYIYTVNHIS